MLVEIQQGERVEDSEEGGNVIMFGRMSMQNR